MNEKLEKFMEKKSGSGDYKVGRGVRVEGTGIAEEEGQDHRETVWKYPGSGMGNILPIFTFQINIFFFAHNKAYYKSHIKKPLQFNIPSKKQCIPSTKGWKSNHYTILGIGTPQILCLFYWALSSPPTEHNMTPLSYHLIISFFLFKTIRPDRVQVQQFK